MLLEDVHFYLVAIQWEVLFAGFQNVEVNANIFYCTNIAWNPYRNQG